MPNSIGPLGIQTATQAELLAQFVANLQTIYGANISVTSDTPDGQWINIFIQSDLDNLDLLSQVNAMFDPDQAIGILLDQRCAINGIQRKGGTFTVVSITLVINQNCNLFGLDQTEQPVYTISDASGNLYQLQTTQLGVAAGTYEYLFQAETIGALAPTPNTITVPVTIVLGVVSINNPAVAITIGENQESDANLRLRRQQSVSNSSQGYLAGLLGTLENIPGVTSAFVYENNSDTTDGSGVPAHSIWVIVAGTPAASDVANAIYTKRNAGCGMFGTMSFTITQINGTLFTVFWDSVVPENLFIHFTATSINGVDQPRLADILTDLPLDFVPGVFQEVNINALATQVQVIDSNTLVTNAGFSDGKTQILTLSGVAVSGTFILNYNGNASAAINWNDSIGTIQSKTQAITGLSLASVTGSIASQTLTFSLSALADVEGLLYVTSNSLVTSAPAPITFSYNEGYTNTLIPTSKKFQFIVTTPNIMILPLILSPTTVTLSTTQSQLFTGLGGYAPWTYSISVNNSGGTINATSGAYTAGSTGSVTDTIRVVDAFGNSATATVTVN